MKIEATWRKRGEFEAEAEVRDSRNNLSNMRKNMCYLKSC